MHRYSLRFGIVVILLVCLASGCERDTAGLAPAPNVTDPIVFSDDFGSGVIFEAFLGSKLDAVDIITDEKTEGVASLRVIVPRSGDAGGGFAGGACPTSPARDLSGYNALTFWAAAEVATIFDVVGLGNDNTGFSKFTAEWSGVPLTTSWQKFVVPIPLPSRLTNEAGMFFFADGSDDGGGFNMWFDEIKFETVSTISNPRGAMTPRSVGTFVGATVEMQGTSTTFAVAGFDRIINHMPGYFDFFSSDEQVATIVAGEVKVVGVGSATITAELDGAAVTGAVTLSAQAAPTSPAPAPTLPAGSVISMFSNAYNDVPIDTWLTDWSRDFADLTEFQIQGDDVKAYTNLIFAGIEFITPTIDASGMTHFHLDVWLSTGSSLFKLKFVDFGDDGKFGGTGDNADSEGEITFSTAGSPPLVIGSWVGLDVPLESLMGDGKLRSRKNLAQLIVSGTRNTAFLDNLYYYK
jgi:hypothetical protein